MTTRVCPSEHKRLRYLQMRIKLAALLLIVFVLIGGVMLPASSLAAGTDQTTDITVNAVQGQSAGHKLSSRLRKTWPWYITRAAGIVAAVLLVLLMLSGIGLVTGYTFRFLEPLTAWAAHRAIGLSFLVAVIIHIVALLFDTYVPFSIAQVLLPFLSSYRPVTIHGIHFGSLYVAYGVFAFYGVLLIIVTSLKWVDKKPHTWKLVHILSYLVAIFIFFHALYLGTDLTHGFFRTLWVIAGIVMGLAALYRLGRARSV